jgi:putative FmdB family regulatory protein
MYEYRCEECGAEIERLQKLNDPAPVCDAASCARRDLPMKKRISRSTFELRGGGWAKDGYSG